MVLFSEHNCIHNSTRKDECKTGDTAIRNEMCKTIFGHFVSFFC